MSEKTKPAAVTAEDAAPTFARNVSPDHLYLEAGCVYPGEVSIVTAAELIEHASELAVEG